MVKRWNHVGAFMLLLLAGGAAGCVVDEMMAEGRPCSFNEQCGPGTSCNPSTHLCSKKSGTTDGPVSDHVAFKDGLPVISDMDLADIFSIPEAGCPKGYTQCGKECVDTTTNKAHCGKCYAACPPNTSDRCEKSKCVCGPTGGLCTGGNNCVNGGCHCTLGGLCTGCCDGDTCLAPGASQSVAKCGMGGQACKSCADAQDCTTDVCLSTGTCQNTNKSDGTTCDDKNNCTYKDACKSGICTGSSYSCDDKLSCTTDTCDGKGGCSNTLLAGYCKISNVCYTDGSYDSTNTCQRCIASKSTSSWSLVANSGCVTTLAGSGTGGFLDGAALSAQFAYPEGVSVDSSGAVYVADRGNNRIRKIYNGVVSTVAGSGAIGFTNGAAASATFNSPVSVHSTPSGGTIYVADRNNHAIRYITSSGYVYTLAGTGSAGYQDGPAASALFSYPTKVHQDANGITYVADRNNHAIRYITTGNYVYTLAGIGGSAGYVNGSASSALFYYPWGLHAVSINQVYVADYNNSAIRAILSGTVSTLTSTSSPTDVSLLLGTNTKLYIVSHSTHIIMVYNISTSTLSVAAGTGAVGATDGSALTQATFNYPTGLVVDTVGNVYIADTNDHRIRLLTK